MKVPHTRELSRLLGRLCASRRKSHFFEKSQSLLRKARSILLLAFIVSLAPLALAVPAEEYSALSDQEVTGLITEWASLKPEQRRALLYEIRSRIALRRSSAIRNPDEKEIERQSLLGRQYGRQNIVDRPIKLNKQSLEIRVRTLKGGGPARSIKPSKYDHSQGSNSFSNFPKYGKRLRAIEDRGGEHSDAPIRFGSGFESRKRVGADAKRGKEPSKKQLVDE